ncbi:hypothetical protein L1987_52476 [Smallanthus sonchifolius]|uniref:Uncharacterized protein n=1 Tax=Smallanthus sonchifolius TaxID=185202 RepID=A0ACB9ESK7_9ASTR|nr:hypothetical protein L1987_52476 [Smallanthus sonchifolius]
MCHVHTELYILLGVIIYGSSDRSRVHVTSSFQATAVRFFGGQIPANLRVTVRNLYTLLIHHCRNRKRLKSEIRNDYLIICHLF